MADAVERFEGAFARWLGVRSACAFWKGRVALYAILRALGIGEGDEVILPGYTCVMDVNPIKYLGARAVFVDIEPATYNLDVRLLEEKITPRTKVVIAQHTYGYPCEMDAMLQVAGRHGIPVVEDCCLALGSTYKGKRCGTFGLASYWSFQWNKLFTTGIGGMVTTSDRELAEKIARVRDAEACGPGTKEALLLSAERVVRRALLFPWTFALLESTFRWLVDRGLVVGSSATAEYKQQIGQDFFKTMGAGQGRAGLAAMRRLDANIAHRRHLTKVYDALLDACAWPRPAIPNHMDPVLVRYPVRVADKAAAVALARHRRLELGTWFDCPLHQILASLEEYDYHPGMCPNAEKAAREVVNLPLHPRAKERHARESVELIAEIGPAA
ncbi:MAG: DegT/DnrJ/EryC1/StrS family aminotransferase [Phycisphaerae bacterium]